MKLEDIAEKAGVSRAAVSLVLNNRPGVSTDTRIRVKQIIKDLGYVHRTRSSRSSSKQQNKTVQFISISGGSLMNAYAASPFFMQILHELEQVARSSDLFLRYTTIPYQEFRDRIMETVSDPAISGSILLGTSLTEEDLISISTSETPMVIIDSIFDTIPISCVAVNNIQGATLAADLIYSRGHQHVGIVESIDYSHNFTERKDGFLEALLNHGIIVQDIDVFRCQTEGALSSDELYSRLLEVEPVPSAFFCENDTFAISLISALKRLGRRIPEECAVIGFDDIPIADQTEPKLTSIRVDTRALAENTLEALIKQIENPTTSPVKIRVDTTLRIRDSI